MKKILLPFVFLCLLSCREEKKSISSLLNFIPPETAMVIKTSDFGDFSKSLSENSFFAKKELLVQRSLEKKLALLNHFDTEEESLLCFSLIGRDVVYTFITKNRPGLLSTDPIQNKTVESFEYDGHTVKIYTLEKNKIYATVLDDVFIGSDSKLIVENVVRLYNLGLDQNTFFKEIYLSASGNASLFIQNKNFDTFYKHFFPNGDATFSKGFTGWTALDIEVGENNISLNGILSEKSGEPNILDFFEGVDPQKSALAAITPLSAMGFYSFTYNDFPSLRENIRVSRKKTTPLKLEGLFASAKEIGVIYSSTGKAVALHSKNTNNTEKALLAQQKTVDEFRGQPIYAFTEEEAFYSTFFPLIRIKGLKFHTRLGPFFIFSDNQKILENIIANHQNGSVLSLQDDYESTSESLSDEGAILFVGINKNLKTHLAQKTRSESREEIEKSNLHDYNLSALQLVRDKGFTHMSVVFKKAASSTKQHGVVQLAALELENPLVGNPGFFENWRTEEQYIVAQDEKNILYLFDNDGKLKWEKQLEGKILGDIQTVDLYKNTRLQMAFATPNKFYVLDRNGGEVAPFPVEFKNPITQPLSIFDYAHNRNYRFVIVQDKKVTMFDNNAKKMKGFEFTQAKTNILQAPKHLRIGTKDYILIPERSGKLNILNRQGKLRVKVKPSIDFSDNPWFLYEGKFTSTNTKGNLVQIDENGTVSTKELDLAENHKIDATSKTLTSISENILTIKGKEVELDYGLYTEPKIFYINNKIYVTTTDTQARKVYLFDSNAELLPGFPVYGNSLMNLANMDNEGKLEFVVQGEDDGILIYRLH